MIHDLFICIVPLRSNSLFYLINIAHLQGNYVSAEKHLLLSVEYSPDSAEANNELLKLYNTTQLDQLLPENIQNETYKNLDHL